MISSWVSRDFVWLFHDSFVTCVLRQLGREGGAKVHQSPAKTSAQEGPHEDGGCEADHPGHGECDLLSHLCLTCVSRVSHLCHLCHLCLTCVSLVSLVSQYPHLSLSTLTCLSRHSPSSHYSHSFLSLIPHSVFSRRSCCATGHGQGRLCEFPGV